MVELNDSAHPQEQEYHDADGQIASWTQRAAVQTPQVWVTEHDPVDQLLGVTVRSNSVAGAVLKRYVYAYDKAGNRTSESLHWNKPYSNCMSLQKVEARY